MAYISCKDGPTRTRCQAVRLYGISYPVEQIRDITGCKPHQPHGMVGGLLPGREHGSGRPAAGGQPSQADPRANPGS